MEFEAPVRAEPAKASTRDRLPTAAAGAGRSQLILDLQRAAGNAAVARFVQRSAPSAEVEEEAEKEESPSPVLGVVGRGGGEPLAADLRAEMEIRLGDDFSGVRVHRGQDAAASAASVSAQAYTVGEEVVLGSGAPALDTADGKRTLAHELTHVVQQRQGPVDATPAGGGIALSDPSDRFELAAEASAERAMTDPGVQARVEEAEDSAQDEQPQAVQRHEIDEDAKDKVTDLIKLLKGSASDQGLAPVKTKKNAKAKTFLSASEAKDPGQALATVDQQIADFYTPEAKLKRRQKAELQAKKQKLNAMEWEEKAAEQLGELKSFGRRGLFRL